MRVTSSIAEFFGRLCLMIIMVVGIDVSRAHAVTYTVINSDNAGAGSLRQAITDANASPGLDTVLFAIPGTGMHLISLSTSLPDITSPIVIDGYSQPGAIENDEDDFITTVLTVGIDGGSSGFPGLLLVSGSSGSQIRGLWMHSFNSASIRILPGSNDNEVYGNIIGLNQTGSSVIGNGNGIEIHSNGNKVGSDLQRDVNSISGNSAGPGILLSGTGAFGNELRGSFIGRAHDGVTVIGGIAEGIRVQAGAHDNVLGGTDDVDPNRIAGTTGAGIVVDGSTTYGIEIKSNLIGPTGGLPIDLGNDGLTANDPGDTDSGPNGLINYPVILDAYTDGTGSCYAHISFQGDPNTYHYIDWYLVTAADASGHGGSSFWLGGTGENTDALGFMGGHYTFGRNMATPPGSVITCTIRDADTDNTSEFAQNFTTTLGELKVTNTTDVVNGDTGSVIALINAPGPDGISLREAILAANNNRTSWGSEYILFDIPGPGPHYIQPTSALPTLRSHITINGQSEPDYVDGTPSVVIDGSLAATANGFDVDWSWCTIRGLAIVNFDGDGIRVIDNSGDIEEVFIGVLADGVTAAPNTGYGVHIIESRNWDINEGYRAISVISNNVKGGIFITGSGSYDIEIKNCHIGTDISGTIAFGGQLNGIEIEEGAHDVEIGTNDNDDRCLISGNILHGILVDGDDLYDIDIKGNYIGTDITGSNAVTNGGDGIRISQAHDNQIGGTGSGEGNVISGNTDDGIEINGSTAANNLIMGNYIGVGANGSADLGNGDDGVAVRNGANNNTIGGTGSSARNIISYNGDEGVLIDVSPNNVVAANYIGTDVSGVLECGNGEHGIQVVGSQQNLIGGASMAEGNLISDNTNNGIFVNGTGSIDNVISGNIIGLDASGAPLGNGGNGVSFSGCTNNLLGSKSSSTPNVISSNNLGVLLSGTSGIEVVGNLVGTSVDGLDERGNNGIGIGIVNSSGPNLVGLDDSYPSPDVTHFRNIISGNGNNGILISGAEAQVIAGNYIGTDVSGADPIPNGARGIEVVGASSNVIIGTDSDGDHDELEGNLISGNEGGIRLSSGSSATGIRITGNKIGTDATGNAPLPNDLKGVEVLAGYSAIQIGTDGDNVIDDLEGNVISGNGTIGLRLFDTHNNIIAGNRIGVGANGSSVIPNGADALLLTGSSADNIIGWSPTMVNTDAEEVGNLFLHSTTAGITLDATGSGNRLSRNSFSDNATLAIDLEGDMVTSNDVNDADAGPNDLFNFPVIHTASLVGNTLTVSGFARPGVEIEFYEADAGPSPDPTPYTESFGEGERYLFTRVEGSADDDLNVTGSYTNDGTGVGPTRAANWFEFSVDVSGLGLTTDARMTALAIDASDNTSEFGLVFSPNSLEVCGNGIDDDGDGEIDEVDAGCLDSDGDFVPDNLDLDNDNDGILDTSELRCDQPTYANSIVGSGALQDQLYFFDWSATGPTLTDGDSQTFTVNDLIITATFSDVNISGGDVYFEDMTAYALAQIGQLYNTAGGREMLRNESPVTSFSFRVDFSATKSGKSSPLDLVVFDSEATSGSSNEHLTFVTDGEAWTFLDGVNINNPSGSQGDYSLLGKTLDVNNTGDALEGNSLFVSNNASTIQVSALAPALQRQGVGLAVYLRCDTDSDGLPDQLDLDSDNDGIYDVIEAGGLDPDMDGLVGTGAITDVNNNGLSDTVDNTIGGTVLPDLDTDSNGIPNRIDADSDGDSCSDVIEAGFPDPDGDGQLGGLVPPTVDARGKVTSGGL